MLCATSDLPRRPRYPAAESTIMPEIQIRCVEYGPGSGRNYEHIAYVGGEDSVGTWKVSVAGAMSWMPAHKLYTLVGYDKADVIIEERNGKSYLRTAPDATPNNNLSRLPDFAGRNPRILG